MCVWGGGGEGMGGGGAAKNVSAKHRFPPHKLKYLNLIIIHYHEFPETRCMSTYYS